MIAYAPPNAHVDSIDYTRIASIIETLFVAPMDLYLTTIKENSIKLEMKKLYSDTVLSKATEETAMELETEAPADRALLQDLIRKSTQDENKKLTAEIATLRRTIETLLPSKNSNGRGQPRPSASNAKKQKQTVNNASKPPRNNQRSQEKAPAAPSTSRSRRRQSRQGPRAAEAEQDSSNANRSATTQNTSKHSNKKKPPSKTSKRNASRKPSNASK